jgi:hypothetical protein
MNECNISTALTIQKKSNVPRVYELFPFNLNPARSSINMIVAA